MTKSTSKLQFFGRGFTLVELLISLVILSMILVLATSIAHQTSRTWEYTNSKIQEFSAARKAFETMANHLAQATLNIYWDYVDANGIGRTQANFNTFVPASYARQSELRFICGQTADLAPNANFPRPCHAIFFQAPLGYSESSSSLPTDILNNLVNSCGFYIEFNEDTALKPAFLQNQKSIKPRYRFRLMEFIEPANALSVYNYTSGKPNYSSNDWFGSAFKQLDSAPVHVLAENIIALILLPKYSKTQDSTGTVLAPFYAYDSADSSNLTTKNQLPPIVQITMVAVDEPSAIKLAAINGNAMPSDLFANAPFREASKYATDLQTLENVLIQKKLNYRIFTTNVAIRAAKWGAN